MQAARHNALALVCLDCRLAICCMLLGLLPACSSPIGLTSSTLVPEQSAMAYFQWAHSASAQARAEELQKLAAPGTQAHALHDVKVALLLSLPEDAGNKDVSDATRLLTTVIHGADPALPEDYRIFAAHWLDELQLRNQLQQLAAERDSLRVALEQVRSDQTELEKRLQLQSQNTESLQTQKSMLEQQNRLMQKQIEALTRIEQQLVDQEQRANTRNP